MTTIMEEFFELLVIGLFGTVISLLNLMNEFADTIVGCAVGLVTIVFLVYKIMVIKRDIQLKNLELREKRAAREQYKKSNNDKRKKNEA